MTYELYHYGVKGMKWGVRQAREAERDLNRKRREYKRAKRARNMSMIRSESTDSISLKNDALRRSESEYKSAKLEYDTYAPFDAKVQRGMRNTAKALATAGAIHIVDKKYLGGVVTNSAKIATKAAVKIVGMTTITAFTMARGGRDIKWKV